MKTNKLSLSLMILMITGLTGCHESASQASVNTDIADVQCAEISDTSKILSAIKMEGFIYLANVTGPKKRRSLQRILRVISRI